MFHITRNIAINENEITFSFIRSSGPGGQNVNKVATAAQLRFDVKNSSSLPEAVKKRLFRLGGSRIADEGVLTCHASIVSREFKIPCVVGTKIGTKILKDGDEVEVDATKGIIKKL